MDSKNKNINSIIYFLILILFVPSIIAPVEYGDPFADMQDNSFNVDDSSEIEGSAPENTPFTQNGRDGTFSGNTRVNADRSIDTERLKTDDGHEGKRVERFSYDTDGYTVDHADFWQTPTHTIIDGNSISVYGDCIRVGDGNTVQQQINIVSEADNYDFCDGKVEIEKAKAISINYYLFDDIGKSTFIIDGNDDLVKAVITSDKDNNSFHLKATQVTLDTGEQFQADFTKKNITINTKNPVEIIIDEETVVTLTERIDPGRNITRDANRSTYEQAVGNSRVVVDSFYGMVEVDLAPTSRYISYSKKGNEPFSLFSEEQFLFKLKKHKSQMIELNNCTQCGMIDYTTNTITLRGIVEYERLGPDNKFIDVVESKSADNEIILTLDSTLNMINNARLVKGSLAHFYSGPFEVKVEDGVFFYNYHEFSTVPDVLDHIEPNIDITNETLTRTLPKNTFILYDRDTGFWERLNGLLNQAAQLKEAIEAKLREFVS